MKINFNSTTGSPILARQTAPLFLVFLIFLILVAISFIFFLIVQKIIKYKKSNKYLQKEQNRKANASDIKKISELAHFSTIQSSIFTDVCKITNAQNPLFLLKSNLDVIELFRKAYFPLKNKYSDEKMNDFFSTLFNTETMVAQTKTYSSTKQIRAASTLFFLSEETEQYPLEIVNNTNDFLSLSLPAFLYNANRFPKALSKVKFIYKTVDGLSFCFVTRIIRYDKISDEKILMIISHCDKLILQVQRHSRREYVNKKCLFSPVKLINDVKEQYFISKQSYEGNLSNISFGGCCIQTELPIKERQLISISIPSYQIEDQIIGLILKTKKLPNELFNLHIKFKSISAKTKNRLGSIIYKFEI